MTTVAVLVLRNDLIEAFGDSWTQENAKDFAAYKIKPYLNLHAFSFYDFDAYYSPVDGRTTPEHLLKEVDDLVNSQISKINRIKSKLPDINSIEALCECKAGIKLLEILAGKLTDESVFYNTATMSSYLDSTTVNLIHQTPDKFVLIKINLHK